MRLGIYGGSFDPVHMGHLLLAECCREQCRLDEVWFMPASIPPHKRTTPPVDPRHRLAMLELAVADNPAFRVSSWEIERGGVSYTAETLAELRRARPGDELFFLLGADALADLPTWRAPAQIAATATLVSVRRAGVEAPPLEKLAEAAGEDAVRRIAAHQVVMPMIELSSRELRARIAAGQGLRYRTPAAVERYIIEHRLYV
ncbi:MAG: nicotinate-nucleotide adenylyltransferase [Pirellulales bacterium]